MVATPTSPMPAPPLPLRDRLLDGLAALYAGLYLLSLVLLTPGSAAAQRVGEIAYLGLGLAVAALYLRNARIPGLDARTRWAWRLLAAGSAALWFSGNAWNLWLHFHPADRYPHWIDHLALGQYLLFMAGILWFPTRPHPPASRLRHLLDGALVAVAGGMLAFHFGLGALLRQTPLGGGTLNSVLDWLLFVVAATGFTRKRDPVARTALGLLLAASGLYLLGNYVLSGSGAYQVGQPVDALWFGAWILRWAAGSLAWRGYRSPRPEPDPVTAAGFREYRSSVFAYLLVGGGFLLLLVRVLQDGQRHLGVLAASATLMAGLLILRQMAEFRENRRLFAAHLAQEARFRSLVQNASDAHLVLDGAGVLTEVGASAGRVFGPDAPVKVGARLLDLFHPEDAAAAGAWLAEGSRRLFQGRMAAADGAWRSVEIHAGDLRDDPAVGGVVLTCRDVAERNELERQLRHAQKLDAVGKLAGGVAHDINNMLAVLLARLDLLAVEGPLDPRQEVHVRAMEAAVLQSGEIVRKLLAFSRRQVVEPVVLDLNVRVAETAAALGPLLGEDVAVVQDLAPDLWRVRIDPSQLDQVLINLLINARDASPQGAQVVLRTRNLDRGPRPAPLVLLEVADRGVGMDPATLARIFEPFFTTKPVGKGTGLGLSTVFGIVDQHGGFLEVDSAPGRGSTFRVHLPAVLDAAAEPAAAHAEPALAAGGEVLLVEDDPALREAAAELIRRLGYRVEAVAGAEAALAVLEQPARRVDLMLTDVIMPGGDGRDLRERARLRRPGLPVVLMSGYTADVLEGKGVAAEGIDFLPKPFTRDELARALREALVRPA